MLADQLFQHVRVCAPAGFGLFPGREHQFVEQHLPELFGRIDIELVSRVAPDAVLQHVDLIVQTLAEFIKGLAVNKEAGTFHFRQYATQRQFRRVVKPFHVQFPKLAFQRLTEQPGRFGSAAGEAKKTCAETLSGIVSVRCVDQITGESRVKDKVVDWQPFIQQQPHQIFYMAGKKLLSRDRAQKLVIGFAAAGPAGCIDRFSVADLHAVKAVERNKSKPFAACKRGDQLLRLFFRSQFYMRECFAALIIALRCLNPRLDMPFFNKLVKTQSLEERIKRVRIALVPAVFFRAESKRYLPEDRSKPKGALCALTPFGKLFAYALFDIESIKSCIDTFKRSITPDKIHGCFFADARNTGDIVGAVAHQGFQVYHFFGGKAVFLFKALRGIKDRVCLSFHSSDIANRSLVGDQLQRVFVSRHDRAGPSLPLADRGSRTQNIIRLIAGKLIASNAHRVKDFLQKGHLRGQIRRHRLALCLISRVRTMAKGRILQVEGNTQCLWPHLIEKSSENRQKTIDRIRGRSVRRRQRADAVERPVHDAVAVKDH